MSALAVIQPTNAEIYRASTDAAGLCREIVLKTAQNIQGRKYVKVEGWQAIAIAHGCTASADDVQRVPDEGMGGFKATGIVRRMSDGAEIARAEGFLGDDETMWTKRPVYARRAMVQTRAISRACRSAFAHVVVLIDSNLSTTPAEEVPMGGFDDAPMRNVGPALVEEAPRGDAAAVWPEGPHTSKSKLMAAWRKLAHDLNGADDPDTVEELITEAQPTLAQFRAAARVNFADMRAAYQGGGDFKGVAETLADARASAAMARMSAENGGEGVPLGDDGPRVPSILDAG